MMSQKGFVLELDISCVQLYSTELDLQNVLLLIVGGLVVAAAAAGSAAASFQIYETFLDVCFGVMSCTQKMII